MISIKYFFSQINWRAVRAVFIIQVLALLFIGSVLRVFIIHSLDLSYDPNKEFISQLDVFLVKSFWLMTFAAFLLSVFYIWYFHSPLHIMIAKIRSIRRGQFSKKNSPVIRESRGQWYQLDHLINKIAKDLKQQKADVAKGRGELEALITAAHDPILAVDRDLNIRYYNAPMANLFEQKEEGHWGKKIKEVVRNQGVLEAFTKAIRFQSSQFVQVNQELAVDSSLHYFQVVVSPFLDEKNSKTRGAVAIFHDITEHKKVEKIRVDFVANASHEIKTPLTSIQGYLGHIKVLIKKQPEATELFSVVESNLQRLTRLVTDLLDLSKLDSEEPRPKELIAIEPFVSDVLNDLKASSLAKDHTLQCFYEGSHVFAVSELLEHVISNLVENAIKYSPPGSIIRLHWVEMEDHTRFSIKDNGPGIESYHQRRIFERFYRVREGEAANKPGTGLGLSIVKNCMLRMGGSIEIKSAPGLGSEFICHFPKPPR